MKEVFVVYDEGLDDPICGVFKNETEANDFINNVVERFVELLISNDEAWTEMFGKKPLNEEDIETYRKSAKESYKIKKTFYFD